MNTRQQDLENLLELVAEMRKLQRDYFRDRQRSVLTAARQVEAKVDQLVVRLVSRQASMFPDEGRT